FDRILDKDLDFIKKEIRRPNDKRLLYLMEGMRQGLSNEEIFELSKIDPWFLTKFREIHDLEKSIDSSILTNADFMRKVKSNGFSDKMIANLIGKTEEDIYLARKTLDVDFEYNEVDTCAAEFKALTPYLYSTTNVTKLPKIDKTESTDKKVMIIGGGPNRIGQGIEFDYC
ncbi:carbamoyl phosphate synthase large subunit, partial [Aliarcobacter butzleri]|nr:carbamoyl phosphate synthase large subunit [Aliarcobacter butzleri]